MPRPVSGRRPDSLFDNRFRYDYIFPRGRSGETLRAYDTLANERPVVIKRPALQDAPPIRAGQEQSILREKRALELLSGHPVLTELLYTGSFRVGGQPHQYIVMDMADGETLESMVLRGDKFPDLELLNIIDWLLDLLQAAHDKHIVYNDVDAKHLFWNRDQYRLKLIDWGNAVFLDSEHPAHITPSTDIYQVGQLLYFILSGGRRLEAGRTEAGNDLTDQTLVKLKTIINRATAPDSTQRYASIAAMRQDLAELRRPLEKNRDGLLERVRSRLPNATSQQQLDELHSLLQDARKLDPGMPLTQQLQAEVNIRLRQVALQADLDAVRIYIENGNLARAKHLIDDLIVRAGESESPMLHYLLDVCERLADSGRIVPASLSPALDALFNHDAQAAARLLANNDEANADARLLQDMLANRLMDFFPGVLLLRPPLALLYDALSHQPNDADAYPAFNMIFQRLEGIEAHDIQDILEYYSVLHEGLLSLERSLHDTPDLLALSQRARQAANNIIELLDVAAASVLTDTSRAGNALWHAAAIDPSNTAFEAVNESLNKFHSDLDHLRRFLPNAEGSNIREFLEQARQRLAPYQPTITDPRFQALQRGVQTAIQSWGQCIDYLTMGGKRPAVEACQRSAESIRPLNPATGHWFDEYTRKIEEAPRVEFLSPNTAVGKLLTDGWEAWDRGRGGEAQASGERALALSVTDGEKLASRRLITLGEILSSWLTNDGPSSYERTDKADDQVTASFLPDEVVLQRKFAEQMPSMQTYLRAMGKGIVEPLRDMSAAAVRAIFLQHVLRGVLALHGEKFDDAEFWREAAAKSLPSARSHVAFQALDNAITRRQLILEVVRQLNNLRNPSQVAEVRPIVRAPLAAAQLDNADQAIRAMEEAFRKWPDGDFRAARQQLDLALDRAVAAEQVINKDLGPFKQWLQDLSASAEVLAQARRTIDEAAMVPVNTPVPAVREALQKMVDITRRDLGDSFTAQLRQWRDTYEAIRDFYTDDELTKDEKLRLFESHFASLFIDRQPTLPIMRHWQNLIRVLPDDPQPIVPQMPAASAADATTRAATATRERRRVTAVTTTDSGDKIMELNDAAEVLDEGDQPTTLSSRWLLIGAGLIVLLIAGIVGFLAMNNRSNEGTMTTTVTEPTVASGMVSAPTKGIPTITLQPSNTPQPTKTSIPTLTPTLTRTATSTPMPTVLSFVPTPTSSDPTLTYTPSVIPTSTPALSSGGGFGSPVPTNPDVVLPTTVAEAQPGIYDLLPMLAKLDKPTWDTTWFQNKDGVWQVGNAALRTGQAPLVRIGPELLVPLLGTNAGEMVKRITVTMELDSYDPQLVPLGLVYFGAGLETTFQPRSRADVRAKIIEAGIVDIGPAINGTFRRSEQLAMDKVRLTLAVERNDDGTLSLYWDDKLVGTSNAAFTPNSPLNIYLFVSTGGVVANVTALSVQLQP